MKFKMVVAPSWNFTKLLPSKLEYYIFAITLVIKNFQKTAIDCKSPLYNFFYIYTVYFDLGLLLSHVHVSANATAVRIALSTTYIAKRLTIFLHVLFGIIYRHCGLYISGTRNIDNVNQAKNKYFLSEKWSHRAYEPQKESSINGHKN